MAQPPPNLFERICQTPEYYPNRAEMGILERQAASPSLGAPRSVT